MRGGRRLAGLRLLGWGSVLALLAGPAPAEGQFVGGDPVCPTEWMIFRSLAHGEFDYCRLHLRYRPGTYDCLRIAAPTCNFVVDGKRQPAVALSNGGELVGTAERIVCPPGPRPPSCPAGYPAGPIPRP